MNTPPEDEFHWMAQAHMRFCSQDGHEKCNGHRGKGFLLKPIGIGWHAYTSWGAVQLFREAVEEAKEVLDRREGRQPATQHNPRDFLRCAFLKAGLKAGHLCLADPRCFQSQPQCWADSDVSGMFTLVMCAC